MPNGTQDFLGGVAEGFGVGGSAAGAAGTAAAFGVNPLLGAATVLGPYLLQQILGGNDADTQALRQTAEAQAKTQGLLQSTLQQELRGEKTPAVQAISASLQRAFRGQRQAAVASGRRQGVGEGRIRSARNQQFNEQFQQMLSDLLAQNYARAQGLASGQVGTLAQTQGALASLEQQQMAELSSGLGEIFADATYKQDPQLKRALDAINSLIEQSSSGPIRQDTTQSPRLTQPGVGDVNTFGD